MKKSAIILGAAAVAVPLFLLAPGYADKKKKAPFEGVNFAHRGLHSRDKSVAENSLTAFRLAAEQGYGVELDVRLSADGQVVVFHDDSLLRVCGVDKKVSDLSYEELSQLRLHDTEDTVPLFSEVLAVIKGQGPIIVELKPGDNRAELCRKVKDMLDVYWGDVCIESFDPYVVAWFRFHGRAYLRGQLAMPAAGYGKMKKPLAFLLSHGLMNFISRPHFMAYELTKRPFTVRLAELLGAMKIGWTSHEPANEQGQDGVIFEFYKPRPKFK